MNASASPQRAPHELSHADLVALCERASFLFERLGEAYSAIASPAAEAARARLLAEWKQLVAADDDARFQRRLNWDGLTEAQVRQALGPVSLRTTDALPAWTDWLAEYCLTAAAPAAPAAPASEDADAPMPHDEANPPLPFADVMKPLARVAARRLRARCGAAWESFAPPAHAALERTLLRRLTLFMAEVLHLEFTLFRRQRIASLDLLLMKTSGSQSDEVYRAFVTHLRAGGLRALLLEYPVMGRLAATAAALWVDATAELITRFAADRAALAEHFAPGTSLQQVTALEGLLSDSHNGGRTVAILTCDTGLRLVYKPRSVACERAWFDLLGWLKKHDAPEPLRCLRVLERDGYGWVEVIAQRPLPDASAAVRYFQRCGHLLALAYVVGANDLHFENLIAVGEQPVFIDLETVLCHAPKETIFGAEADDLLRTVFFESVVRTGLLPRWQTGVGRAVDVSGLGAVTGQASRVPIPMWKDVNTDLMELAYETVMGTSGPNAALLDGQPVSPNDHVNEIAAGFRAMIHLLIARREEMLAHGGPLHALSALSVRFIFRATAQYLMTAKGSRAPHLLRDGAHRSIYLEPLVAPLLFAEQRPTAWPLIELERLALEVEDCPYFTAPVHSADIADPRGGAIQGVLEAACYDQMAARLRRLDEADLQNQLGLLYASFDARGTASAHETPSTVASRGALEDAPTLTPDALLDEAARVGALVLQSAVPGTGRAPHWITLRYLPGAEKNQLDPVGADLFEGRAGIALLFAALFRATGEASFGAAARAIAQALSDELKLLDPARTPPDLLVHGATGLVSLSYVFTHLAALLAEESWLAAATRAAQFITPATLAADQRFDVLSGAAGSILALLRCGDLERAVQCGDHLLAHSTVTDDEKRCWATFEGRAILGFAHGQAGIAYALLQLAGATGAERFRAAALAAIAYENSSFSAQANNWPDLRWAQPSFAAGWCHGGPGIALARLAALAQAAEPAAAFARDLEHAAALAQQHVADGADHLCCGNFGRVLLLQELSARQPALQPVIAALAARLVQRAQAQGRYRLMREYAGYVSFPGLFQGLSGVSYALLRLARPDLVPNVICLA